MACRRDLLFWLSGSRLPPWRGLLHVTLLLPRRPQVALPRPIPFAADAAAHAAAQVRGAAQTAVSCHHGSEQGRNQGNLLSTCEGKAADNPVKTMLCKKVIICTKGKPDTAGDPVLLFTTTSQDKQTQKKPICTGL